MLLLLLLSFFIQLSDPLPTSSARPAGGLTSTVLAQGSGTENPHSGAHILSTFVCGRGSAILTYMHAHFRYCPLFQLPRLI